MFRRPDELRAGSARLRVAPARDAATANRWRVLAALQRRAAEAGSRARLAFSIVNETGRLIRFRQAVLWRRDGAGRLRVQAVSGVSRLVADTPNALWLAGFGTHLATHLATAGQAVAAQPVLDLDRDLPALPAALASERDEFMPGPVRIMPIAAGPDGLLALLVLNLGTAGSGLPADAPAVNIPGTGVRNAVAPVHDAQEVDRMLAALQPVWSTSWRALAAARDQTRSWSGGLPRGRRWRRGLGIAAAVLAVLVLALPVRLTVLAPAEVIALDAVVVAAPMDGVVQRFAVEPNQAIRQGQILFALNDTTLRNRRAVASQQLQVARAEVLAAAQKAFTQDASRAELAALEGRVAERAAELAWVEEQLDQVAVRAPADGVAIFTDPNDWIGRPVTTGERVAQIGDPASAGVLIWLSVNDALDVALGAEVRLFLPTAPLQPLAARLIQTSYLSVPSPDGIVAYRLRARFEDDAVLPRIGLHGTAKLYGERAPLAYYLFRRPLAALREWTGW